MIGSNQSPGDSAASPPADSPVTPVAEEAAAVVPAPAPASPAPPKRPGWFRRTREWFWRGAALRALREQSRSGSPHVAEYLKRGWLALELADRALRPSPLLVNGNADGPARELARQAVYWALRAERLMAEPPAPDGSDTEGVLSLWQSTERRFLVEAAGGEGAVFALETSLRLERFSEFAALSAEEQARQARELATFARSLLATLEAPRVRLDKVYAQRLLRTGGLFMLFVLLVVAVLVARSMRDRDRDWAREKPWTTSSSYPNVGCKSPHQDCAESPFFFFHTLDDDRAWVEVDLGTKKKFSAIKLINREDCCGDRAAPLAIEVSNDRKSWREIARRQEVFNTWTKEVTPVTARYVRVIALRKTALHLKRFSVLR